MGTRLAHLAGRLLGGRGGRALARAAADQEGLTLLETAIALGIVAAISVAFLSGLDTANRNTNLFEQKVTAMSLVQSEAESIKAAAYNLGGYPVAVTLPTGFAMTVDASETEPGKQEIIVGVSKDSHPLYQLTVVKTDW
jgi:type II secretory pathway pseudopilin PulG